MSFSSFSNFGFQKKNLVSLSSVFVPTSSQFTSNTLTISGNTDSTKNGTYETSASSQFNDSFFIYNPGSRS